MKLLNILGVGLALSLSCGAAAAQEPLPAPQFPPRAAPTVHIQAQALPILDTTPNFNAARATKAYLAQVSGPARAKSDAYAEGGYGLMLADLAYGLAVAGLLLGVGLSARLRDWVTDRTHWRGFQAMLYGAIYITIVTVATLPLTIYEGFVREHAYGLSNQTFLAWAGDFAIGFALTLVAGVVLLPMLYAAIRSAREAWWIWGAGLAIAALIFVSVITPVFIAPLFNHYAPLPQSPLRQEILSLARANQIPADNVYVVDASRQTKRISANVSGFLGTTRISLNDNLLHRGSHDEILAVLGHEMGHYVMDHQTRVILLLGLVMIAGFGFVAWAFGLVTDFFGGTWHVRRVDDIAGLPLLVALASIYLFVMTPVTNGIIRAMETQADIFGLDAVRKPDAFATVILKLSAYRKLDPGAWEEAIFYDHPSGHTRIDSAMRWKAEHIRDHDMREPLSPQ